MCSADDVLAGYAERLADPSLDRALRGYLSGSLDLVLRLPGPRFAVVDYKTNRLGGSETTAPSAWHYRPAALTAEMYRAHYPLQALLYTVALHRYLRWRLPGYDPGASSRRHPLPVRARHEQPRIPPRRRPAVWRVVVATATGAHRVAQRPLRPGPTTVIAAP